MGRLTIWILGAAAVAGASCSPEGAETRMAVASFYPLAYAAERVAGPGWEVIDLTPPGSEAHDVELSVDERSQLESAEIVLYLGDLGFQPQVEDAVDEASGEIVAAAEEVSLNPGHEHEGEAFDPHVWLDPGRFAQIVDGIGDALARIDADHAGVYRARAESLRAELVALDDRYRSTLEDCRYRTLVVAHEAFGYVAERYGLEQFGLTGLSPEGEPSAESVSEAQRLIFEGEAGAVFHEGSDESIRVAGTVAQDAGVPALPLLTLESQPPDGDFLSIMDENLGSLRRGLGCR